MRNITTMRILPALILIPIAFGSIARAQSLDQQEHQFTQLEKQWKLERHNYEREIRRLLSQLRRVEIAA